MNRKSIMLSKQLRSVITSESQLIQVAKLIVKETENLKDSIRINGRIGALKILFERIDKSIEESFFNHNEVKPSCKKGCAFCCHINVDMTTIEAELILDYCEENNIEINYSIFENQKNLDNNYRPESEHSKCAFLDENNQCKIYPVRPVNCRSYYVINEPKFCNIKEYPHFETSVLMNNGAEILTCALISYSRKNSTMQQIFLDKKNINNGTTN